MKCTISTLPVALEAAARNKKKGRRFVSSAHHAPQVVVSSSSCLPASSSTHVVNPRGEPLSLRSPRPAVTSAATIRSRFLHSLGILEDEHAASIEQVKASRCLTVRVISPKLPSFFETLKGDYGQPADDDSSLSTDTASTTTTSHSMSFDSSFAAPDVAKSSKDLSQTTIVTTRSKRGVSFDSAVVVHPIPRHDAYSKRVKCILWQSSSEMQENTARNCFEFASEGWDWQKVLLDEEMIEVEGGERIHPIHFFSRINDELRIDEEHRCGSAI